MSSSGVTAELLEIELKPEVVVTKTLFYWGDVASFSTDHPLSAREIGQSPKPGQSLKLHQVRLKTLLSAELVSEPDFILTGAPYVVVRGGGTPLNRDALSDTAQQFLEKKVRERFPGSDIALEVKAIQSSVRKLLVPEGVVSFRFHLTGTDIKRRMNVLVDVLIDRKHFHTIPVWFSVKAETPVWTARKDIERNSLLKKVEWVRDVKDLVALSGQPTLGQIDETMLLDRPVSAGEVLLVEYQQHKKLVNIGQQVTAFASYGSVTIALTGIAEESGGREEIIRVLNPKDQRLLKATVINEGIVRIN